MKTEKPFWNDLAVFICTKCGKKLNKPDFAENLKVELKSEIKNQEQQKSIRVMTSSCLGTCPEGEQAIALVSKDETKILIFDPNTTETCDILDQFHI